MLWSRAIAVKCILLIILSILSSNYVVAGYSYYSLPISKGDKFSFETSYIKNNTKYMGSYIVEILDIISSMGGKKYHVKLKYERINKTLETTKYLEDYMIPLCIPISVEKTRVKIDTVIPVPFYDEPRKSDEMPFVGYKLHIDTTNYTLAEYIIDPILGTKILVYNISLKNGRAYVDTKTGLLIEYMYNVSKGIVSIKLQETTILENSIISDGSASGSSLNESNNSLLSRLASISHLLILIGVIIVIAFVLVYKLVKMYSELEV